MFDTVAVRVHGINDIKKDTLSQVQAANGFGTVMAVPEHNDLYKAMLRYRGKHFSMSVVKHRETEELSDYSEDDFMFRENSPQSNVHMQARQVMQFVDEKRVKEINMRIHGTYRVPSSYNGVTFSINENGGFIEFQLSIPKYLYGHSLAEFVPQINSDLYQGNWAKAETWNFQQKNLWDRFDKFLDKFISDLCNHFSLELLLNKRYIEITRLDLCFNQWFNSKEDSLRYLDHLKHINYKRYKANAKAPVEYNTSLTYTSSSGSYFKIYHKGTEYSQSQHGDKKRHIDANMKVMRKVAKGLKYKADKRTKKIQNNIREFHKELKDDIPDLLDQLATGTFDKEVWDKGTLLRVGGLYKALPYKVDFFKKEMDKVLRYEVSLRGKWFSYYYKHKVFRKDCEIHRNAYYTYRKVKNAIDSRTNKEEPSYTDRKTYKTLNGYLNTSVHLMMRTNGHLRRFEKYGTMDYNARTQKYRVSTYGLKNTILHDKHVGTFGPEILSWAVKHFKKLVDFYQVDAISDEQDLERKIKDYNDEVERKVAEYNEVNRHLIKTISGRPMVKGRKIITEASQLLTDAERRDQGMKKIRPLTIITVFDHIKKGRSLREIRLDLGMSSSSFSRLKADLNRFGYGEATRFEPDPIETCTTWTRYYQHCGDYNFNSKFFVKRQHQYYE